MKISQNKLISILVLLLICLYILQILNSLCTAGFKLSQSLSTLAHCTPDQSATQTPLGMSGHSFSGASQPGLNVLSGGATSGSLSSEGISGTSGKLDVNMFFNFFEKKIRCLNWQLSLSQFIYQY